MPDETEHTPDSKSSDHASAQPTKPLDYFWQHVPAVACVVASGTILLNASGGSPYGFSRSDAGGYGGVVILSMIGQLASLALPLKNGRHAGFALLVFSWNSILVAFGLVAIFLSR